MTYSEPRTPFKIGVAQMPRRFAMPRRFTMTLVHGPYALDQANVQIKIG